MKKYLKIHNKDNVVISLKKFDEGEKLKMEQRMITVHEIIPFGHKIAIDEIKEGDNVYKYGLSIGYATSNIAIGSHVHSHNLKSNHE